MTERLTKLNQRFNSKVKLMQFALDGNWEQAWVVKDSITPETGKVELARARCPNPFGQNVESFLQSKFKNIACEVFFEDTANNHLFFGIKYLQDNKLECYQFISKLYAALSPKSRGVSDIIDKISCELGSIPLLSGEPSHIEVGVVDFWKTCGAVILWQQGEPKKFSEADIKDKLQNNKQLICTERNYQAIEFAFEGVYPHWLGIQVGERKNSIYQTELSRLVSFASELFGFESVAA